MFIHGYNEIDGYLFFDNETTHFSNNIGEMLQYYYNNPDIMKKITNMFNMSINDGLKTQHCVISIIDAMQNGDFIISVFDDTQYFIWNEYTETIITGKYSETDYYNFENFIETEYNEKNQMIIKLLMENGNI